MAVRVSTTQYEWTHGHKPRQERFAGAAGWAFEIDALEPPIFIYATYQTALKQAKQFATFLVTVLP